MTCPSCGSDSVQLDAKVEADLAVLGEDEYVEHCLDCHSEWVRATAGPLVQVLRPGYP